MLPIRNPDVIYRAMADSAVLFSTQDEVYYGLNAVGARIWELLPPATETLDALCGELAREYPDVGADVLRADVLELLQGLEEGGLVIPRDSRPNGTHHGAHVSQAARPDVSRVD